MFEELMHHGAQVIRVFGVDPEGDGDNDVGAETHGALKVVALPVLDQIVDNEDRQEEDDGLEALEVQRHVLTQDPAEDDKEGGDEEGDLHGAADGDADGQVHLVLVRDDDGSDVLGRIADDGQQNQTNEGFTDARRGDDGVNAVDQVLGAHSDQYGDEDEADGSRDGAEDLGLVGLAALPAFLRLCVEQPRVRLELEDQVQDVQDQQDDRSAARQDQDIRICLLAAS